MTKQNPDISGLGDDDGGFEGPDIETVIENEPVGDAHGELNDSADSYISPARTGHTPGE